MLVASCLPRDIEYLTILYKKPLFEDPKNLKTSPKDHVYVLPACDLL
jgi:hypothetical protein